MYLSCELVRRWRSTTLRDAARSSRGPRGSPPKEDGLSTNPRKDLGGKLINNAAPMGWVASDGAEVR